MTFKKRKLNKHMVCPLCRKYFYSDDASIDETYPYSDGRGVEGQKICYRGTCAFDLGALIANKKLFDQLRLFNHLMKSGVEEWEGFAKAKEDCHAAWYGATINETR